MLGFFRRILSFLRFISSILAEILRKKLHFQPIHTVLMGNYGTPSQKKIYDLSKSTKKGPLHWIKYFPKNHPGINKKRPELCAVFSVKFALQKILKDFQQSFFKYSSAPEIQHRSRTEPLCFSCHVWSLVNVFFALSIGSLKFHQLQNKSTQSICHFHAKNYTHIELFVTQNYLTHRTL